MVDQALQAVKFTDKNAPGLSLALDEEFQAADCFSQLIREHTMCVIEPYIMMDLHPTGPTRFNLEVIVPSSKGLTPAMWKQTATLCPLEWPSNHSLLRLWHTSKSFHQYAAQLKQQVQHRHMFTHWEVNRGKLASRVLFRRPAHYVPETILQQHVRERTFPDRRHAEEHQRLTWLLFRRNAMSYGFWLQRQKVRTLSPLRLGTAGMIPSEQTSNTTLNTLHEVRHSTRSQT